MKTYITEIEGSWYAFEGDAKNGHVYSIGNDNPPKYTGASRCFARWTKKGIQYVASPSANKKAAIEKAKRAGDYFGEV